MKLFLTILFSLILICNNFAQVSTINICRHNVNRMIPSNSPVYDTIFVNIPNSISVLDVNVKIDTVECTWDAVLQFRLSHLSVIDTLILYRGGSGDNFVGTVLNDSASIPIASGTPPFTGTYRPDRPLSQFNTQSPNGMWILRISADSGGDTGLLKAWCLSIVYDYITSVPGNESTPEKFALYQNYPNPFNPITKIKFDISGTTVAQTFLYVYDMLGREVETLVNKELSPGSYEVDFDGSKYASGIYYYSLKTSEFTDVKKMVLIK